MELTGTPNCGIAYLNGVQQKGINFGTALYELLYQAAENLSDAGNAATYAGFQEDDGDEWAGAIILFTTARSQGARGRDEVGQDIIKFIQANNLGSVAVLTPVRNPHTANFITLYAWSVNPEGLQKWYADEYARRNPAPKIVVKPTPKVKFSK